MRGVPSIREKHYSALSIGIAKMAGAQPGALAEVRVVGSEDQCERPQLTEIVSTVRLGRL